MLGGFKCNRHPKHVNSSFRHPEQCMNIGICTFVTLSDNGACQNERMPYAYYSLLPAVARHAHHWHKTDQSSLVRSGD